MIVIPLEMTTVIVVGPALWGETMVLPGMPTEPEEGPAVVVTVTVDAIIDVSLV